MGEIKVTLENWLGQVHFETTQEKIDEFNEEYYDAFDELCEENNYTEYVSTFCFDPYLIFDNNLGYSYSNLSISKFTLGVRNLYEIV